MPAQTVHVIATKMHLLTLLARHANPLLSLLDTYKFAQRSFILNAGRLKQFGPFRDSIFISVMCNLNLYKLVLCVFMYMVVYAGNGLLL